MKMNSILLVSVIILLPFCRGDYKITENEDKGIKEIINYYGGKCQYGISFTINGRDNEIKCFKLELSQSQLAQRYYQIPEMVASNMAYLFYKNLHSEKEKYDGIQPIVILDDGKKTVFTYPVNQLRVVHKRMALFDRINAMIKNKDYRSLAMLLNDSALVKYNKATLIANMSKIDSSFGDVTSFNMAGFRFYTHANGMELLHLCGIIVREKENNEFSIEVDPNSNKDEVFLLQYKL